MLEIRERYRKFFRIGFWLLGALAGVLLLLFAAREFVPELAPAPEEEGVAVTGEESLAGGGLPASTLQGKNAPEISLFSSDGASVRLSQFRGEPLAILFWASWNEEGIHALETLSTVSSHFPQVRFITISSQEPEVLIRNYLRRSRVTLPVLFDPEGSATEAYGVEFLPTIIFVDAGGVIRQALAGPLLEEEIEAGIAALLH